MLGKNILRSTWGSVGWRTFQAGLKVIPDEVDFGFAKIPLKGFGISYWYSILFGIGLFFALFMLIVNSIKLMTSGHNPEKTKEAMAGIQQAILGLLLIVIAAALVVFVNNLVVF